MGVYVCVIYMCLVRFSPQDFHIIPGGFCYLLGENLLLCLTPENFFKFDSFPGGSSSSHRSSETGCKERSAISLGVFTRISCGMGRW